MDFVYDTNVVDNAYISCLVKNDFYCDFSNVFEIKQLIDENNLSFKCDDIRDSGKLSYTKRISLLQNDCVIDTFVIEFNSFIDGEQF